MRRIIKTMVCFNVMVLVAGIVMAGEDGERDASTKTDNFTKLDSDKDGKLSKVEYTAAIKENKKAEAKFASVDSDKDGFVTREEYKADFFKRKDADDDGKLSLAEFTAANPGAKDPGAAFGVKDTDKDGFLTLKEFNAAKGAKTDFFARIDANKDGKLSPQEHAAAYPDLKNPDASFKAKDANQDGLVSEDELKAASDAYKAKKKAASEPNPGQ